MQIGRRWREGWWREDKKGALSQSMVSGFMLCSSGKSFQVTDVPTLTYFPFWDQGPAAESQHLLPAY